MDSAHSILRSARHFFAGTFLSRISGMARDIAMAFCFGSAPEIAAFMVAYRLANLFRRLFGEGNLQAGFVPHFESVRSENLQSACLFYRDTVFSMGVVLLGLVGLIEMILFAACHWVGDDWRGIIELSMWMVPGLFFICLYALNSSLLLCQKKNFLPAVAPVFFNFVWIGAVFLVWELPREEAAKWLSLSVTGAFAAQWIATAFAERRLMREHVGLKEWFRPHLFSNECKALLKPLSLGIVGIGAVQFNSALDAIFARLADPSGPSFLWFAIRVQQLPLALFGIALSGALLPPLARAMRQENRLLYRQLLQSSLRHSAALMLFCTFGIISLGGVGINLLYGHGDFSPMDVNETLLCLWGYGIGLVPSVFVLLLAGGFYAQKNYRIPTIASLSSVGANVVLNAFFVFGFGWGAVSIAIATSASAFLNAAILGIGLKKQIGEIFGIGFWRFFLKMSLACALPAAAASQIGHFWMGGSFPRSFSLQILQCACLTAVYMAGVAFIAWRFQFLEFLGFLRTKKLVDSQ